MFAPRSGELSASNSFIWVLKMRWVGLKHSSSSTHLTWYCSVLGAGELGGVEQCQGSECHVPWLRAVLVLWDVWLRDGRSCPCPIIPRLQRKGQDFQTGFEAIFYLCFLTAAASVQRLRMMVFGSDTLLSLDVLKRDCLQCLYTSSYSEASTKDVFVFYIAVDNARDCKCWYSVEGSSE